MKFMLSLTLSVLLICRGALGQYKTGIKTHYPAPSSGNLVADNNGQYNSYSQQQYAQYNGNFKPAETYQGGPIPVAVTRAPVILDPTAEFINKTRSGIASGICYQEVPTASLYKMQSVIPAGNGSTSALSKIQVCCDGYERNPHVYARCDPICADDCPNGICTAPNTCVCIPGHIRNDNGKCITTCPIGCGNGICDDDGQCKCKTGYKLEPQEKKFCNPICEPACAFGKCIAPNKCDCQEGFRLTGSGVCEPKCDNCENGICTGPGVCSCKTGYVKMGNVCQPMCALGCDKGYCKAPDTCDCYEGFELDRSGTKCVPHCDIACANGYCDGNNKCSCNPGYELKGNTCLPHCPQGCINGYCTAPNFCMCNPGYIKTGIKGRTSCNPA